MAGDDVVIVTYKIDWFRLKGAPPLPPPADLRASGDGTVVRLSWRRAPGHDPGIVYVVRRAEGARPLTVPAEGEQVYRDSGDACADERLRARE